MTATIPTTEPSQVTAGDTWKWTKSVPDYSAADGWQLSYQLRGPAMLGLAWATEVTAHSNGRDFSVVVPVAKTERLLEGTYHWAAYVTKAGERFEVDFGNITVRINMAVAPVAGGQTHAERTLAVIEAALEGRLTGDLESYTIAGRSVTKIPVEQLWGLRSRYRAEVWRERHPGRLEVPVEVTFTPID